MQLQEQNTFFLSPNAEIDRKTKAGKWAKKNGGREKIE